MHAKLGIGGAGQRQEEQEGAEAVPPNKQQHGAREQKAGDAA